MHLGKAKLSIRVTGIALGTISAMIFLCLAILGMIGVGLELIEVLASLFLGFDASVAGIVIGTAWGFLYGGVLGSLFAWFYNKML
jgi:hypothetical protein